MRSVFLIPVFNQALELPIVLRELAECDVPRDRILLVNNGSSDGSEILVRESGYPFLDVPANLGIGYSLMLGADWALERGYDVYGALAGNAKMLPSEMHRVLDPIERGEAEFVCGSRFLRGGDSPNLPSFRRNAIPAVSRFVQLLTGVRITDATCGYRAFRLDLLRRAEFDWHAPWLNRYGFESYLYAKVLLDGAVRWREVPITMRYPPKGQRYSKIPPLVGWYDMLKPWVVARMDGRGFRPEAEPERRVATAGTR
ncbi:MAG: glycosyltransferase family 2 protein [Deltaproteobacteria bacterium]|nr:glycosyltransferase family 2 protein [Deltaproteobacteria bacterium]